MNTEKPSKLIYIYIFSGILILGTILFILTSILNKRDNISSLNNATQIENSNLTNQTNLKQESLKNNSSEINTIDIYKSSILSKSELDDLNKTTGYLLNPNQNQSNTEHINNSVTFVSIPTPNLANNTSNVSIQNLDYSKFNVVSTDPNVQNKNLQKIQTQANNNLQQNINNQKQSMYRQHELSSKNNSGNDIIVPPEHLSLFKNMKSTEFGIMMKSLEQIQPYHPEPEKLKKIISQYNSNYSQLITPLNKSNVNYGDLQKIDADYTKMVKEIHSIHQQFSDYTSKLYNNGKDNGLIFQNTTQMPSTVKPSSVSEKVNNQSKGSFNGAFK